VNKLFILLVYSVNTAARPLYSGQATGMDDGGVRCHAKAYGELVSKDPQSLGCWARLACAPVSYQCYFIRTEVQNKIKHSRCDDSFNIQTNITIQCSLCEF
jgi:hypothetical protein